MAAAYAYTPILGWSSSRYSTFEACKRKYFYHYYPNHDPVYPRQRIEALKEMITVPLATGKIVHDLVDKVLKRLQTSGGPIKEEYFLEQGRYAAKYYSTRRRGDFAEVYYGETGDLDADAMSEMVVANLHNWFRGERFHWIQTAGLRSKGKWIVEPPNYGETRVDGLKAYFVVDFLSPTDDGLVILDWKTGGRNDDKYQKQLEGYASWAALKFNEDPARIDARLAYLYPSYHEVPFPANDIDVDRFLRRFHRETEEMYEYCVDIEANIPRDKNSFPLTDQREVCAICNFRELCER